MFKSIYHLIVFKSINNHHYELNLVQVNKYPDLYVQLKIKLAYNLQLPKITALWIPSDVFPMFMNLISYSVKPNYFDEARNP